jgi:hypothetical protein
MVDIRGLDWRWDFSCHYNDESQIASPHKADCKGEKRVWFSLNDGGGGSNGWNLSNVAILGATFAECKS